MSFDTSVYIEQAPPAARNAGLPDSPAHTAGLSARWLEA